MFPILRVISSSQFFSVFFGFGQKIHDQVTFTVLRGKECGSHKKRSSYHLFFRWVSASTGLLAFILFMPKIFVEHSVLDEQKENIKSDPEPLKRPNPKKLYKKFSTISMVDGQLLDVPSKGIIHKPRGQFFGYFDYPSPFMVAST